MSSPPADTRGEHHCASRHQGVSSPSWIGSGIFDLRDGLAVGQGYLPDVCEGGESGVRIQQGDHRLHVRGGCHRARWVRLSQLDRAERNARAGAGTGVAKSHDINRLLLSQGLDREQQSRVDIARGQLALGYRRGCDIAAVQQLLTDLNPRLHVLAERGLVSGPAGRIDHLDGDRAEAGQDCWSDVGAEPGMVTEEVADRRGHDDDAGARQRLRVHLDLDLLGRRDPARREHGARLGIARDGRTCAHLLGDPGRCRREVSRNRRIWSRGSGRWRGGRRRSCLVAPAPLPSGLDLACAPAAATGWNAGTCR